MSKKKNILLQIILSLSIISLVIDLFVNENKSHIFVMIASILISLVITQLYLERKEMDRIKEESKEERWHVVVEMVTLEWQHDKTFTFVKKVTKIRA